MQYTTCKHCGARIALTPQNTTGICPAFACPEEKYFYEADGDKPSYHKRMLLTRKYRGLYFASNDGTLHFFYGLDKGNMLFIEDMSLALHIYNESELKRLAKHYQDNNLQKYKLKDIYLGDNITIKCKVDATKESPGYTVNVYSVK
ncbi:MAG: hypothetical protein NC548_47430 [Lachnospiraceae bacterium]|nr:hypothetical protein [Lachnospiraceae bacterium]MCM1259303.1 hypothetical protein [Roseburia sp.]